MIMRNADLKRIEPCRPWRGILWAASLSAVAACGTSAELPDTGEVRVTVGTAGPEQDANGYRVSLDGQGDKALGLEDSVRFEEVEPGSHQVALTDIADNCAAGKSPARRVTVVARVIEHVAFQITCTLTAALRVITQSQGEPADPDGYQLRVPGEGMRPIGANDSIMLTALRPGTSDVELTDLAPTCSVTGTPQHPVDLVAGDTAEVTFQVVCEAAPGDGTIVVTVHTQAVNAPMPTGYALRLDGGSATPVLAEQSVTLAHVPAGMHSIELSGMPPWCMAGSGGFPGSNPVRVSVIGGSIARVSFGVLCLG